MAPSHGAFLAGVGILGTTESTTGKKKSRRSAFPKCARSGRSAGGTRVGRGRNPEMVPLASGRNRRAAASHRKRRRAERRRRRLRSRAREPALTRTLQLRVRNTKGYARTEPARHSGRWSCIDPRQRRQGWGEGKTRSYHSTKILCPTMILPRSDNPGGCRACFFGKDLTTSKFAVKSPLDLVDGGLDDRLPRLTSSSASAYGRSCQLKDPSIS